MPPHQNYSLSPYITPKAAWRGIKVCLVAATIVLTGCATNSPKQSADASSLHQLRDNYLSRTTSDPLGAYLTSKDYSTSSNAPTDTHRFTRTALNMLGIKYRLGGDTPNTGFDCSGLVIYAAEKSLGLKLPRRSAEIAREGESVKLSELKKGDLVFFNTLGSRNSHVGIYLGNKKFVHSPRSGSVVRIESMDIAYWKKRYNGARRLAAARDADPFTDVLTLN
ncbi:MAG: C40 family peptidase [Burkholderiaceae bacterium]|nr:C40 family peptidase [Burkholderiaceae bacterium]